MLWDLVTMSIEPLCKSSEAFSLILVTFLHILGALIMYWGPVNTYCDSVIMSWEHVNMS
jgi:hypothetical protein